MCINLEEFNLPKAKIKLDGSILSGGFLSPVVLSYFISILFLISLCLAGTVTDIVVLVNIILV